MSPSLRDDPAACERCELLPAAPPDAGVLYLWPPLGHTRPRLADALRASGAVLEDGPAPQPLVVRCDSRLGAHVAAAARAVTRAERLDCLALALPHAGAPSLAELGRMRTLEALAAQSAGQALVALLRDGQLFSHFQPIVALASREVFGHEALLRVRGGGEKSGAPGPMLAVARAAGLLFHLDRAARLSAIEGAIAHGLSGRLFINFSPAAIYDPQFCLRTTVAAIERGGLDPARIVFEVTESEHVSDPDHLVGILDYYRQRGFQVALDDLGAGYSSLNLLARVRPDFVKLDMELIRGVDHDPFKARLAGDLIRTAAGLGIKTVAEGIETRGEWEFVSAHGADYAQGFYLARPGAPPPALAALD